MLQRCTNPSATGYNYYGRRGVSVCNRWRDFRNFLADLGPRPASTVLGRYMDSGDYEPGNCAWMTKRQQAAEQKKKRLVSHPRALQKAA